jgi:hypothetical protein
MGYRTGLYSAEKLREQTFLPWSLVSRLRRPRGAHASEIWKVWRSNVLADRIHYWFFDDIVAEPQTVVDGICSFLGVETGSGSLAADHNRKQGKSKIAISSEMRKRLTRLFLREYEACAGCFGGHALTWYERALARLR